VDKGDIKAINKSGDVIELVLADMEVLSLAVEELLDGFLRF
jgi:rRNA maturation endonuclease Nob1